MSKSKQRTNGSVELGRYIVADPMICHGKPTFKGTRVFVADVLADVERGLSWDFMSGDGVAARSRRLPSPKPCA
jgi:hypothetical protein